MAGPAGRDSPRRRVEERIARALSRLPERAQRAYLPEGEPVGGEVSRDPRVSPLLADDLSGLPPAYVATAGFDPLRDEGEEYAHALTAGGGTAVVRRHPGQIHGFVNLAGFGRNAREAVAEMSGALRLGLAPR